ncbi:N-acetyl-gamma-glutamyl-phosphate reductase [Limisalsivibrio acetivorans]|uniref:N-acetyl-gamma-glutamyl-phosphate reductase n=1 Tax=Limisalsivibrio acetivorans TaxID=1304888 RepID=UPI0003B552B1|nr:N-acetyl-gamma-glutamyl-phosphate reductase [Limisalsivibrio acetivorans]
MKVSVIGATGYTGFELVKILRRHPGFEIADLTSDSSAGETYSSIYPSLRGVVDNKLVPNDFSAVANRCDAVFLCLPHAASQEAANFFHSSGKKVVDLSADFRVRDKETYETTYGVEHKYPELLEKAVYGIPEIYTEELKSADMIANPGCYPTSVITPLFPLLKKGLVQKDFIIADSKSGVSGAGKKPSSKTHFCEVDEDFKPYGVFSHRHNPEINHILSRASEDTEVTFTPHLLPVIRGIETTIYLKSEVNEERLRECIKEYYSGRAFVRFIEDGSAPSLAGIKDTNFIDIALFKKGDMVIIVSCLDNLIKGASGMAVQNLNIAAGLEETAGLI